MSEEISVGLGLETSLAIVTGAGGQIGQVVVEAFLTAGCYVCGIDVDAQKFNFEHERLLWQQVDVTEEEALAHAFSIAKEHFKQPACICVTAAGLDLSFIQHHKSITSLSADQFRRTLEVNTTGTFLTAKVWLNQLKANGSVPLRNASLILFGSESGTLGEPGNADYATSKAAVQYGLTRSLAPDIANVLPTARVNAVAPGPVDTPQFRKECEKDTESNVSWLESGATVALKRAIPMADVAKVCLMLASENFSSSITGQIIPIDGGKNGKVLWDRKGAPMW